MSIELDEVSEESPEEVGKCRMADGDYIGLVTGRGCVRGCHNRTDTVNKKSFL